MILCTYTYNSIINIYCEVFDPELDLVQHENILNYG